MADVTRHRILHSLIFALAALIAGCVAGPPVQEMSDARQVIRAARDAGVAAGSNLSLDEAERLLGQAEAQLQRGEYRGARRDALAARDKAAEALRVVQALATEHSG
ncbi:MAG: hypothetical protein ABW110_18940 [Steroidobacteraceae bacterium]